MIRLFLMRHAKSAWPAGVKDHDRPLAPRGRSAAPLVAGYLATEGIAPDLVLISSAKRTRETFALIAGTVDWNAAQIEPRIYDAAIDDLFEIVRAVPSPLRAVLMIGHNPGLQDFALALLPPSERQKPDAARLQAKFPTAGLAALRFAGANWNDLAPHSGMLAGFITPRDLGGVDED